MECLFVRCSGSLILIGGMIVSVHTRYLAVAVLIGAYVLVLPFAVQWLVPGAEYLIFGVGALLAAIGMAAVAMLLSPKVRAAAMAGRNRTIFYASVAVLALYLCWAGSLLVYPISE